MTHFIWVQMYQLGSYLSPHAPFNTHILAIHSLIGAPCVGGIVVSNLRTGNRNQLTTIGLITVHGRLRDLSLVKKRGWLATKEGSQASLELAFQIRNTKVFKEQNHKIVKVAKYASVCSWRGSSILARLSYAERLCHSFSYQHCKNQEHSYFC